MSAYAEFAVTTNFSFLRGASDPEELVIQARNLGLTGIGIADRNSVAGVVCDAPGPGYAWVDGFWDLRGSRWVWVDGRWARPPRGHTVWIADRWERDGSHWRYYRGHWR